MENNGEIKQFTLNLKNVRIVKCCASCRAGEHYFVKGDFKSRLMCMKGKGVMSLDDVCNQWDINDRKQKGSTVSLMTMEAKGNGKVKSPHYIAYYRAKLDQLDDELKNNVMLTAKQCNDIFMKSVQQWIKEYEYTYGSRYL